MRGPPPILTRCRKRAWHGVDTKVTLDLLLCWNATRCRPPLSEGEVARTVENIVRIHLRERMGE